MYGLEFPELNAVLADVPNLPELKSDIPNWMSYPASSRSFCGPVQPIGQRDRKGSRGAQDGRKRPPPYPDPAQRLKGECMNA